MIRRSKQRFAIVLILAMVLSLSPLTAWAAPRATKVELSETTINLDLAGTRTFQLTGNVLPSGASQRIVWSSANKSVATISTKGLVTAKKTGTITVGARPYNVKKWTKVKVVITDSAKPASLSVGSTSVKLIKGTKYQIEPSYLPVGSATETSYASKKSAIASVTSKGVITAKKLGTTSIKVQSKRNTKLSKIITVKVVNPAKPTSVVLTPATKSLIVGETLQLTATVNPASAPSGVTWKTGNKNIATVSSTGIVTALKPGTVKISAYSKARTSVGVVRSLTITDPNSPTGIGFLASYGGELYFLKGDTGTLEYNVTPSTARTDATFKSSNTSIVSIDASTGKFKCNDTGVVNITVTANGTKYSDTIRVTVSDAQRVMTIPARTTDDNASDIKSNLAKIDAIMASSFTELTNLKNSGAITASELNARKQAIGNAFANYGIAWSTPTKVTYWNSALSATNDFRTGRMYYGMPYIQNGASQNYTNRRYVIAKAVQEGYFKSVSGTSRIYTMTSKRMSKYYVGNDCSSFASMSVWGTNHSASYNNTVLIASSKYYKTITNRQSLRPGDLLNKSGSHVIMFLYYTNSAKTQMMLIDQGGNTVKCSVENLSKYASYTIKRPLKYS